MFTLLLVIFFCFQLSTFWSCIIYINDFILFMSFLNDNLCNRIGRNFFFFFFFAISAFTMTDRCCCIFEIMKVHKYMGFGGGGSDNWNWLKELLVRKNLKAIKVCFQIRRLEIGFSFSCMDANVFKIPFLQAKMSNTLTYLFIEWK